MSYRLYIYFNDNPAGVVDIRVLEDYSTDSFVLGFIRFASRFGYPKYVLPDPGRQLVKGCESIKYSFSDTKQKLPYRGKLRRGKVTKFFSSDKNYPRRKFSPTKVFPRRKFSPDETFAPTNIFPQRIFYPVNKIDMSTLFCEIFNTLGVENFREQKLSRILAEFAKVKNVKKNLID